MTARREHQYNHGSRDSVSSDDNGGGCQLTAEQDHERLEPSCSSPLSDDFTPEEYKPNQGKQKNSMNYKNLRIDTTNIGPDWQSHGRGLSNETGTTQTSFSVSDADKHPLKITVTNLAPESTVKADKLPFSFANNSVHPSNTFRAPISENLLLSAPNLAIPFTSKPGKMPMIAPNPPVHFQHAPPTDQVIQPFRGKNFGEPDSQWNASNRSAVFAVPTIWCKDPYVPHYPVAPWPCLSEMEWEGPLRAKSEDGRFGRVPPMPRLPAFWPGYSPDYKENGHIVPFPIDKVFHVPTEEDIIAPVDPVPDDVAEKLLDPELRNLLELDDESSDLFASRITPRAVEVLAHFDAKGARREAAIKAGIPVPPMPKKAAWI
jgi:hypothetical protein